MSKTRFRKCWSRPLLLTVVQEPVVLMSPGSLLDSRASPQSYWIRIFSLTKSPGDSMQWSRLANNSSWEFWWSVEPKVILRPILKEVTGQARGAGGLSVERVACSKRVGGTSGWAGDSCLWQQRSVLLSSLCLVREAWWNNLTNFCRFTASYGLRFYNSEDRRFSGLY